MVEMALTADDIEQVLVRYFRNGDRSADIVQAEEPMLEVDLNIVKFIMERTELHDEDFCVFKRFKKERATILDVGANFGYSATSIWAAGSKSNIMSFEPIKGYAPILAEIARLKNPMTFWDKATKPVKYDFCIGGVSSEIGTIEFVSPIINGKMHSALTTADKSPDIGSLVRNNISYIENNLKGQSALSFKLYKFNSPVTTIDTWLKSGRKRVGVKNIEAIKIDTEGFEGRVLVGASKLLASQKPLIMAECGHVIDLARNTALQHGYSLAERIGDQLVVSNEITKNVNGFFIHPDKFKYYRSIGLLSG